MTTTIVHDDLAFTIRTTHFPGAHIATITSTDPSIGYRVTLWRDWPSARLATEHAISYITKTFPTDATA
jgi:hypothetical protein